MCNTVALATAVESGNQQPPENQNLHKVFCKKVYDVVKKFVSEREMSAQEAALDATSLPLIEFSRQFVAVQANTPYATRLLIKPERQRKDAKDLFYSLPVTKYIHSTYLLGVVYYYIGPVGKHLFGEEEVDFDNMSMFEFFSQFTASYTAQQDGLPGITRVQKRRRLAVVVPTPYRRDDPKDEDWCYQILMMFTPFRCHTEVLVHPTGRSLNREGEDIEYVDEEDGVVLRNLFRDMDEANQSGERPRTTQYFGPYGENSSTPYPSAIALVADIIDKAQHWPAAFALRRERATLVEHAVRNDMRLMENPSEEDIVAYARRHSLAGVDGFSVEEVLALWNECQNARQQGNLKADPLQAAFHGQPAVDEVTKILALIADSQKTTNFTTVYDQEVFDEQRLTTQDLLDTLAAELRSIRSDRTIKVRQKAVLLTLGGTIEDILLCQLTGRDVEKPRTCRMVLQGEAGTGKTFVLCKAEDMCMKYLGRRSVRSFAPTANACKNYANGSTLHRVFHKAVRGRGNRSVAEINSSWLDGLSSTALISEMRGVQALIGDEMSMISPADIDLIDKRMQEALKVDNVDEVSQLHIDVSCPAAIWRHQNIYSVRRLLSAANSWRPYTIRSHPRRG